MAIFTRTREEVEVAAPAAPASGNGSGAGARRSGPDGAARRLRDRWGWLVLAMFLVAGTLLGVEAAGGTSTYPVTAVFAQAPGLFPGASVQVLGVPVGTVTSVRNVGDEVVVGLAVARGHPIPSGAEASLVSPQILGEPSIDLSPGYTGGPALPSGATIPMRRTAVPVSTERLLESLQATLQKVNPHAVGDLITNLAQDLQGQGKNLNTLIAGAAGTLKLLATKANDLGQLSGSLAQLTGSLDSRTSQITQLITAYDTVSGVVAQHSSQLGGAITQLSQASTQLIQLLVPDLVPIESDVGSVTRVGRTLDRNLTAVDQTLSSAAALFAGAGRAFTPTYNWLKLNSQLPTGLTGAILANMVRDRLAGVCRRILANRSGGLTGGQRQTLATCGNPASSFFSPIIDQVPTVLNDVRAGQLPTAPTPGQLFSQGLSTIPGAAAPSSAAPSTGSSAPPSSGAATPGRGATGPGTTTATPTTPAAKTTPGKKSKTCLGGLLGTTVTCTTGSTGSGTGTSGGSGGGGLLSYHVPATTAPAASRATAPALVAAATRDLPPLPATAPGGRPSSHRPASRHRRPAHRRSTGTRPAMSRRSAPALSGGRT